MKRSFRFFTFFIATILTAGIYGCDMASSMKDHLKKDQKESKNTAKEEVTPKAQPKAPAQPKAQAPKKTTKSNKPLSGNELARVGNWRITVDEFNQRLSALNEVVPEFDTNSIEAKKLILDELVRQQLLVEEAEKTGLANNSDIGAAVEEFRRTLIVREVAKNLTSKVNITDEDAMAFYEEKKDQILDPPQYRVSEIVMKDELKANEIRLNALKGSDFGELAKLNSIGKTKSKGGDLGYLTEEPFLEMGQQILSLKEGEISNVFKGPEGFYIIKLVELKGGEPIPFEEIKEDIIQSQTLLKQQEAILGHIDKIRQKIPVEVREDLLN